MITAGIDCGSQNTKGAIVKDGVVVTTAMVPTAWDADLAAQEVYDKILATAGLSKDDIKTLVITGVGRDIIKWGDKYVAEPAAAAKGAKFLRPETEMVIDMGADSGRVICLNPDGSIMKFEANDMCAAGAGTFIEAMARALQIKTEEMGDYSLRHKKPLTTNAQCVVFAESEVISLIHSKESKEDIAFGVHMGIANRMAGSVRRLGLFDNVTMIGGPGYNKGLVQCISDVIGRKVVVADNNQVANAIGAALIAAEN